MRFRIHGGTARTGDPPLCTTCRHATVVKGGGLDEEIVECDRLSYGRNRVRFGVTSCTEHINRTHPTVREMEEIAWVLRSDPKRNEIGFVKASELRPRDRFVLPDDWS